MMGTVTVVHGDQIDPMIEQIASVSDALNAVHYQDTVLIKPNLVVSRREWAGVNTDPRIVEAIVKILKAKGISRIVVGDGAGMGYNATKAMQILGEISVPHNSRRGLLYLYGKSALCTPAFKRERDAL